MAAGGCSGAATECFIPAHPRAAIAANLRDHAVRLMKRRGRHGLSRRCDGKAKAGGGERRGVEREGREEGATAKAKATAIGLIIVFLQSGLTEVYPLKLPSFRSAVVDPGQHLMVCRNVKTPRLQSTRGRRESSLQSAKGSAHHLGGDVRPRRGLGRANSLCRLGEGLRLEPRPLDPGIAEAVGKLFDFA